MLRCLNISLIQDQKKNVPYESIERLCLDVWSPYDKVVHHISHNNDKPFELMGTSFSFENSKKSNLTIVFEDFKNQSISINCGSNTDPILFMARVFAIQPSFFNDKEKTMQCIGTVCVLKEYFVNSKNGVKIQIKNFAESRNLTTKEASEIVHPSFSISSSDFFIGAEKIFDKIEENLKTIYKKVTEKETEYAKTANGCGFDDRLLHLISPVFLSPNGVPFNDGNLPKGKEFGFSYQRCKGFTVQSYWRTRNNIVSDRWILKRLEESLNTRGKRLSDIVEFFKKPFEVNDELMHYLVDIIRISTIHSSTRPYIPDKKWKKYKDGIESYEIDDYNIASVIPGDCEDGAGLALSILWCIIEKTWYSEETPTRIDRQEQKLLEEISRLVIFAGIPFGVNGSGKVASCGHSFGCVVPFHAFLSMLRIADDEQLKLVSEYEKRNNFIVGSTMGLKHSCVIETTVLTSTLYHDVKQDEGHLLRFKMNNKIKTMLENERGLLWKNYHVQEPLSKDNVIESKLNRLFCPILPFYFGNYNKEYFTYNHTFSLFKNNIPIVDGVDFFGHDIINLEARVIIPITPKVYEADKFFYLNFDRPVVPLCTSHEEGYDFFRFDNNATLKKYKELKPKYKKNNTTGTTRINLFCWKLVDKTEEVIESIKSLGNCECVGINSIGNGFCIGFIFS